MTRARISFVVVTTLSVLVALATFRFFALGLLPAFPDFGEHIADRRLAFLGHVVFASVALAVGSVQFAKRLRSRRPAVHRWIGRLYVLCVLIAGLSGIALGPFAPGGWVAGLGFMILGVLWIITTGIAVAAARRRDFAKHRDWMIRSFALTFAGVTLRLLLAPFVLTGGDYVSNSVWLAWACWVPNILFAEWLIARSRNAGMASA